MTLVLSNSKANTYQRCAKKYEFNYIHKIRTKAPAVPLRRGTWLHELIEIHYTGSARLEDERLYQYDSWRDRLEELGNAFYTLHDTERAPYGDLPVECERIMRSYIRHYREVDKGIKIIGAEIDEVVELPNGDSFRFIIDLIVELPDGSIWFWDHKTVGRFMPEDFILMDSQLTRYFWAARKKLGINARGVMFNELITTAPTVPEILKNGQLTRRRDLATDYRTYRAEIARLGLKASDYREVLVRLRAQDAGRWFRRTRLARSPHLVRQEMRELLMTAQNIHDAEDRRHYPRTRLKSCTWDCEFAPLCMIDLVGGNVEPILKLKYEKKRKSKET